MPFNRPTLQDIISRIESDINSRVEGSTTFLRNSAFKILARVFGGSQHLVYEFLKFIKDQLFISSADAEHLERHGGEYGIYRNIGTKSTGTAIFTGTAGTVIPSGTVLQSSTGNNYKTSSDITIAGSGTGTGTITADDYGVAFDEGGGTILSFISPLPGVLTEVVVDGSGLTGGQDEETDEEFRERILARKRTPPHGGAEADYKNWVLEYSGVTRAWTIPLYQGVGTIGLVVVNDDDDPIFFTSTELEAIKTYIVSHTDLITGKTVGIPVTAEPGFFMIEATPKTVNLSIQIYPNTAAIRSSALSKLQEAFLQYGGPAETLSISNLYEAVTGATGEVRCKIIYPTEDVGASTSEVHVLGDVTFEDYV